MPPEPSGCAGILSVTSVEGIDEGELPEKLQLPPSTSKLNWTLADVSADGVLGAVFEPPPGARSC